MKIIKTIRLLTLTFLAVILSQISFAAERIYPSLDENLRREEITVQTGIAEIKIKEAQNIINEAREQAFQGIITSSQAAKIIQEQQIIIYEIQSALASILNETVEKLKAEEAEEAYINFLVQKKKVNLAINDTRRKVLKGEITSTDAIKIIKEQNAIIAKITDERSKKINSAIGKVKVADDQIQESSLSSFVSGSKDLGMRALAPFKSGYGYTEEQKAIAQRIIDGLMEQQARLTKDYEEAKKNSQLTPIERVNLKKRYETIIAELNDEIYQQQLITGDAMSTQRKLFWAAVATGAAVAGMYFLAPGTTITPEVVKEIEDSALSEKQSVPAEPDSMVTRKVSELSPIDTTFVDTNKTIIDKVPVEHTPVSEQQAKTEQIREPELLTEETEITTPEKIAQLLKESDEDRAQQAEREAREEELLNKRIQWQDELWLYHDATNRAFEKFAQEHMPPADVQKVIEENKEKILSYYNYLPLKGEDGSYVAVAKGDDVTRIFNADAVRQFIENNGLTSLEVPKKWIYNVDGYDKLFAEYIDGEPITQKNPLNLKETQDLVAFVEKTGYGDFWDNNNILRDSRTGKLVFIDLEDSSFRVKMPLRNLISNVASSVVIDDEAWQWLENYYEDLKQDPEFLSGYLPQRQKWDEDFKRYLEKNPEWNSDLRDLQVDYYLHPSDEEKIMYKIRRGNKERERQSEEEKSLQDIH